MKETGFDLLGAAHSNLSRPLIDAAPDCILLVGLDGIVIIMNKAARLSGGLEPHESERRSWFEIVPPDMIEDCQQHFAKAAGGEPTRFPLTTHINGKTTYWDIVFSPVLNPDGQIAFILSIGRDVSSDRMLDVALSESAAREKLVTQEMQHRIKNLFSVVSVLVSMAEREAKGSGKPEELAPLLKAKISALARASEATYLRTNMTPDFLPDSDGEIVDLPRLVAAVVAPYASMVSLKGEDITTRRQNITTLTLFLHELATNSAKYGALGHEKGHVELSWGQDLTCLTILWKETGGPRIGPEPIGSGFGSQMIDRLISLAGGSIERNWLEEGLVTRLQLPV